MQSGRGLTPSDLELLRKGHQSVTEGESIIAAAKADMARVKRREVPIETLSIPEPTFLGYVLQGVTDTLFKRKQRQ